MKKRATLLYPLLTTLLLTACGGGGGSGGSEKPTEPTRAAGLYMTAINNPVSLTVKSVASSNRMALKAAKAEIVNPENGEQIDPSVGLYATDEGGKEFKIHFELTDDTGVTTGYDEKVELKSAIQVSPDTVYLELWVTTNTNGSVETRQYLTQFTTGKMIEVQRLALGDSFLNNAFKYVLPANSLHNGTGYPIVMLNDHKWHSLDADWETLVVAKELVSNYVSQPRRISPLIRTFPSAYVYQNAIQQVESQKRNSYPNQQTKYEGDPES